MEPFLKNGNISGKIVCPNEKCGVKIGNFDWAGVQCGCKEWVTPVSQQLGVGKRAVLMNRDSVSAGARSTRYGDRLIVPRDSQILVHIARRRKETCSTHGRHWHLLSAYMDIVVLRLCMATIFDTTRASIHLHLTIRQSCDHVSIASAAVGTCV